MFGKAGRPGPLAAAGVALSSAAAVILMGIITAEALYPGAYSTGDNEISDLGGTRPPDSVVLQPSAAIFDGTMLLAGAAILLATFLVHRGLRRRAVSIWLGLFGAGAFLVGVFPGSTAVHPFVATLTFVSAGVVALVFSRTQSAPGRYVSAALGSVTVLSTILGYFLLDWAPIAELGDGGIERWIAYPAVLWLAVTGGYLMAHPPAEPAAGVTAAGEELTSAGSRG
ncbi:MAG TPA: DUF998 domain-containing protein [Mycobacteriales bacterium]